MGKHKVGAVFLAGVLAMGTVMTGCSGKDETEGKTVIEMVQYKPEAVDIFEQFQDEFNATHDDIYLKIDSPNDAMTILKTRFIREDNPDIIGIGGDINYSNFLDADMLMDISDFEGLNDIKEKYLGKNNWLFGWKMLVRNFLRRCGICAERWCLCRSVYGKCSWNSF